MKLSFKSALAGIVLAFAAASLYAATPPSIIPLPEKMELHDGAFTLKADTAIYVDATTQKTGEYLAAHLRKATGFALPVSTTAGRGGILITTAGAKASLGAEGYELSVTPDAVVIRAPADAGAFYGVQTLLQLLPTQVFDSKKVDGVAWIMPCVAIEDMPRYVWRGFMLDVSRHFTDKEGVKTVLDSMAVHKLNMFHWHLVDDQGARIEIKKYPKLTSVSSWRKDTGFPARRGGPVDSGNTIAYGPDGRYGGFYTQDDIKEIVAYATALHITIVPEIEMPGHTLSTLAAYPEFGCRTNGNYSTDAPAGVNPGVYCVGNPGTFPFVEDILTEVMALFPGKYIHVGCDEVPARGNPWQTCPKCQALMEKEGLKSLDELQSYYVSHIVKFLEAHGRTPMGWSEITKGKALDKGVAVTDWLNNGFAAAREGHDVVMSPTGNSYFDYYQSANRNLEPSAFNGVVTLEAAYTFDPLIRLSGRGNQRVTNTIEPEFQSHILGGQANLWSEQVPNLSHVEYMMYPRLSGMAEALWSPKASLNWDSFTNRLVVHEQRLAALNIHYRREPAPLVAGGPVVNPVLLAATPPQPYGPVPTARQLQWQAMEFTGFLHFTVNTFTGKEWGDGSESEKIFNPTDFNADQIVKTCADAGMKELILTCKHHDGFCLWPSAYTEHSVKNSPWKDGKGDVVKDISEACRKYGIRFGVYLSPWDRNNKDYGTPEYLTYYRNQLTELLSNYGPISEVWLDGANGGTGTYGGTGLTTRKIDNTVYYDWTNTWALIRKLQPMACIFSDAGPDTRWVGNENGVAGPTCWATINNETNLPGHADSGQLNRGNHPGTSWVPAACDVSIRPGWFYLASRDAEVKTPAQLVDLYFNSVGRGAGLLLNVPPDKRGQIADPDAKSLAEFHRIIQTTFATNLAFGAKVTASNTRGNDIHFSPLHVLDHRTDTYWSTDDNITNEAELTLELPKPVTFNVVELREYLPLGERVSAFAVDAWQDGKWVELFQPAAPAAQPAGGRRGRGGAQRATELTSIGNRKLLRGAPVTTDKVRLRILKAEACPAISEFGLYNEAH